MAGGKEMIEIQNLTKRYGQIKAVNNLNFTVEKGEILGFLGPNGAGKSTTMNIITGYLPSSTGTVKVCGYDILESPKEVKKTYRLSARTAACIYGHDGQGLS